MKSGSIPKNQRGKMAETGVDGYNSDWFVTKNIGMGWDAIGPVTLIVEITFSPLNVYKSLCSMVFFCHLHLTATLRRREQGGKTLIKNCFKDNCDGACFPTQSSFSPTIQVTIGKNLPILN